MLRRQALRGMRRPLVVMSPKSLLRHPLAVSSPDELANGTFLLAIGEIDDLDPKAVKRVVLCSGKVYYDLLEQRRKTTKRCRYRAYRAALSVPASGGTGSAEALRSRA